MTMTDRATRAEMTWEWFDPGVLGYDLLGEWLQRFYSVAPWDEYWKCFSCTSEDDFTHKSTWGRGDVEGGKCPDCGSGLSAYWSKERARSFFGYLGCKGPLTGIVVRSNGEPAACLWGYQIDAVTPVAWEPKPVGAGVYVDRIIVLPQHRNGISIWYLLIMTLREFAREHEYLVTRTHIDANVVRTMLRRLNFAELNECPVLPERTYWVRSLDIRGGMPPLH